jgi:hypothetical protein
MLIQEHGKVNRSGEMPPGFAKGFNFLLCGTSRLRDIAVNGFLNTGEKIRKAQF